MVGRGKGREGKARQRRRVSSRTVAGRRTVQGRAEENSFIMDAFFKKREGKKCSADEGTVEKGTLGLVRSTGLELELELDRAGPGRAGQDRTGRGQ